MPLTLSLLANNCLCQIISTTAHSRFLQIEPHFPLTFTSSFILKAFAGFRRDCFFRVYSQCQPRRQVERCKARLL
jgi:hypothetical protein